ncbi:malonyl-CoA decarboxylase [Nitrospirillum sp. BR 11163]|uniref:malonyl-CoA decarboxylase n=1 Tax=Nitrospirillum sp. BR 11163 TaxID=3104323 RepID=UPI002AFE4F80|nr:malonyl-CoA decarboxylase [Nitrospirillum sp. BR 11163]MEA1672254.1 malonyl-CoA decarboxylase [Nitrospirillum sp. BR 11163]
MSSSTFFRSMLTTIADRGRALLRRHGPMVEDLLEDAAKLMPLSAKGQPKRDLPTLCDTLLSGRGEASGVALAEQILDQWATLNAAGQRAFLLDLAYRFGPDPIRLDKAIDAYRAAPGAGTALTLHNAAEARRQELFRRLNLAPGGTEAVVRMREALFRVMADAQGVEKQALEAVDADFSHLLASWFNRGFLVLRHIDWTTPANILEKIIRYEAVHTIRDWDDLRRRLAPSDRRCFAFFHPQLLDDPLIFVEVALAPDIPASIDALLAEGRAPIAEEDATTAVFYSISNCQEGLRGVSFGNFLIKQVVEDLRGELPNLKTFVTLSPVPAFAKWLARERKDDGSIVLRPADKAILTALDQPDWQRDPGTAATVSPVLLQAAAHYFLKAKARGNRPVDPVARFHLGNGARLERLNFLGDLSPKGLAQSHGLMVNYLYKLDDIETNHERYADKGEVVAAAAVRRHLKAEPKPETGKDEPPPKPKAEVASKHPRQPVADAQPPV